MTAEAITAGPSLARNALVLKERLKDSKTSKPRERSQISRGLGCRDEEVSPALSLHEGVWKRGDNPKHQEQA